ncbi:uncharacterized protein C8Q71DRAFT_690049, partial [Rhodofomes roseus]
KTHVNITLTPDVLKVITRCASQVRGELKTKMRAIVGPFYGFQTGERSKTIKFNRDLADKLKEEYLFVYQDIEKRRGLYKTELLQLAINVMWFAKSTDEGVVYYEYFHPIPKITMALILTVV